MSLVPAEVELNEDERTLIEAVRDFSRKELLARDGAWDRGESSVGDVLGQLAEMGLLGLLVPQKYGGLGCDYRTYAAILHEIATCSAAAAVTVSVHGLVCGIVDRFVAEPVRTELLSHWAQVDHFGAFALSEAGAGSDAASAKTTATPVDGGYHLNGEKMWVTNGLSAGWFFVLARVRGASEGRKFCAFMVDGRSPGLSRTEIKGKMGIRGSETAVIDFADVFVPQTHLVGKPGEGMRVCLASLGYGRIGIAAQATGIGEACLTEMISYARQREQFGRPIGTFGAVAGMIADSVVDLEAAKALVWQAASGADGGGLDRSATSMAKLYASEAANRIAYRAVQVHGGSGYVNECRVERLYRDARITTIYEGTSEIQRMVIARELGEA